MCHNALEMWSSYKVLPTVVEDISTAVLMTKFNSSEWIKGWDRVNGVRVNSLASHQQNNSLVYNSNDEVNSLLNQFSNRRTLPCATAPSLKGFCQWNDTSIVVAAIKCCVSQLPFFHVVNDFIPKRTEINILLPKYILSFLHSFTFEISLLFGLQLAFKMWNYGKGHDHIVCD